MIRSRLAIAVVLSLAAAGTTLQCTLKIESEQKFGLVANHTELAAPVAAAMQPFAIVNPVNGDVVREDNSRKVVKLWAWDQQVTGQRFLPHYPQLAGDCVSFAFRRAHIVHQAVRIARGEQWQWKDVDPTFTYSTSRVLIGNNQIRGDGSVVTWAGKAGEQFGILFADQAPPYSLSRVQAWSYVAPPADLMAKAEPYRCSVSPITSVEDVTDAICNGYPVPFGSHQFAARRFTRVGDKQVAVNAQPYWAHAQCIDGYDGSGPEPLWHVQNSWPLSSHPAPTDDSPPGGYWIRKRDLQMIVSDRDIVALSMLKGFPKQALPDLKFFDVRTARRSQRGKAFQLKTEVAL